ncbi:hypothetical protein RC86_16695 [Pectobacterium brasiliense]|nr:hypothetical protein RC86_16695 [Pectobacterium brasiliense]
MPDLGKNNNLQYADLAVAPSVKLEMLRATPASGRKEPVIKGSLRPKAEVRWGVPNSCFTAILVDESYALNSQSAISIP